MNEPGKVGQSTKDTFSLQKRINELLESSAFIIESEILRLETEETRSSHENFL